VQLEKLVSSSLLFQLLLQCACEELLQG